MSNKVEIDPEVYDLGFTKDEISEIITAFDGIWSEESVTEIVLGLVCYRKWVKNNVIQIHVSVSNEDSVF